MKRKIDLEKKEEYNTLIKSLLNIIRYPNSQENWETTKENIINKINLIKDEKELIDCIIELSDNSFKLLCDNIQISEEVINLREKYKTFKEFIMTIKSYKQNKMILRNNDDIEKRFAKT